MCFLIKEHTKAEVGIYHLCFESKSLKTRKLEFKFVDDARIQEEQNRIQSEIAKLTKSIDKKKNEIMLAQKEHEEVAKNKKDVDTSYDDRRTKLGLKKDPTSTQLEEMIKNTKSTLDAKKTPVRNPVYPKDDCLEKTSEIMKREGEASGMVGIIADLGFVDAENVDKTLANYFGKYITAVIVKDKTAGERLKKEFEKSKSSASIIPLDNLFRKGNLDQNGKIPLTEITDVGFVGYVVNLIDVANSDLRHVFYNLFGETMVFDTYQHGYDYRSKIIKNGKCPTIITLDGEKLENSGIIYGGKKTESSNRFGQLPFALSKEYKKVVESKKMLEELKEIMKMRTDLANAFGEAESKLNDIKKKNNKVIQELNEKIGELEQQKKAGLQQTPKKKTKNYVPESEDSKDNQSEEVEEMSRSVFDNSDPEVEVTPSKKKSATTVGRRRKKAAEVESDVEEVESPKKKVRRKKKQSSQ
jgi:chromosome segregation ATPase